MDGILVLFSGTVLQVCQKFGVGGICFGSYVDGLERTCFVRYDAVCVVLDDLTDACVTINKCVNSLRFFLSFACVYS